jgi:hypothetical protein
LSNLSLQLLIASLGKVLLPLRLGIAHATAVVNAIDLASIGYPTFCIVCFNMFAPGPVIISPFLASMAVGVSPMTNIGR